MKDADKIAIATRIPRPLATRFRKVAEAQHRSVSGELRYLVEKRIAEQENGGGRELAESEQAA